MPPKKTSRLHISSEKTQKAKTTVQANESNKNALSSMFKKIESKDSVLKECNFCNQRIKSCLFSDHINTKCPNRKMAESKHKQSDAIMKNCNDDDDDHEDIIFISSNIQSFDETSRKDIKKEERLLDFESSLKLTSKTIELFPKIKDEPILYNPEIEIEHGPDEKKFKKSDIIFPDENILFETNIKNDKNTDNESEDDMILLSHCDSFEKNSQNILQIPSHKEKIAFEEKNSTDFDYNLKNFEDAIKSVINQEIFSHLMNEYDCELIQKFSRLSSNFFFNYYHQFIKFNADFYDSS